MDAITFSALTAPRQANGNTTGSLPSIWPGRSTSFGIESAGLTMAQVMVDYLRFAKSYYGTGRTSELHRIKHALRPVKKLYAAHLAAEFGPVEFKAVREQLIEQGLTRPGVNAQIKRIARMFKWSAGESKLPASVYQTLRLIPGLKRGRTVASEPDPIKPVSREDVEATVKHLLPIVADMVRIQLECGCRPGEICKLTPAMVDRSGDVWLAKLGEHKTAHHGRARIIYFGPKSQEILRPYLLRGPDDCLFRPCDAVKQRRERDHASRQTPPSCGNKPGSRAKTKGKRKRLPGIQYDTQSYARAIKRAAEKAGVPHWSPNQLRHTKATEVRSQFGLDAAASILGHAQVQVTQVYAEQDQARAIEVARKIG